MKRDLDLIRKILLEIEKMPAGSDPVQIHSVGGDYSSEEITHHLGLVHDVGFIDAEKIATYDGTTYLVHRMTWGGHDYLDSVRSDAVWSRVQRKLGKIGGTAALESVKQLAIEVTNELLK